MPLWQGQNVSDNIPPRLYRQANAAETKESDNQRCLIARNLHVSLHAAGFMKHARSDNDDASMLLQLAKMSVGWVT